MITHPIKLQKPSVQEVQRYNGLGRKGYSFQNVEEPRQHSKKYINNYSFLHDRHKPVVKTSWFSCYYSFI